MKLCYKSSDGTCEESGLWMEDACDARGIYIAKVCDQCRDEKLPGYRPEVLTDPNYHADEPIEPEE